MINDEILGKIKYYNLIPILLTGFVVLFLRTKILNLYANFVGVTERDSMYTVYYYFFTILLLGLWGYFSFKFLRARRYHWLTGRNYERDTHDFNKTYSSLVEFFTTNDPYKMDLEELPTENWHYADGIILGKVKDKTGQYRLVKRDSDGTGNLATMGLPGCGKSTTQAATTALRFNSKVRKGGCGVFAISIKGDLLKFVRGKRKNIKVFTPDKEKGSCHYNPLEGLSDMSSTEQRTFIENLSINICPDENGDNSMFFVNGARDYFCAIAHYLLYKHSTGELEGELKFPELVDAILMGNVFDVTLTIKNSPCKVAGEYSNSYEGSNEKNVSGIYNHLCKCIRPFNSGALRVLFDGKGDCIKPEDLETHDIYIDVPQDKYQVYAPAMAIITTNFLYAFMRRKDVATGEKVTPALFLLDEAVQLNLDYKIISQAMSTLRSKKVSIFLLFQSVAQIEGRYGEAHAREIIDLCAYISVFNAQDPKSRKFFQELIGRRKMLKRSTSLSSPTGNKNGTSGTSVSVVDEYIFETADFGDLNLYNKKTKHVTKRVLIYANGKYVLGETTPYYE